MYVILDVNNNAMQLVYTVDPQIRHTLPVNLNGGYQSTHTSSDWFDEGSQKWMRDWTITITRLQYKGTGYDGREHSYFLGVTKTFQVTYPASMTDYTAFPEFKANFTPATKDFYSTAVTAPAVMVSPVPPVNVANHGLKVFHGYYYHPYSGSYYTVSAPETIGARGQANYGIFSHFVRSNNENNTSSNPYNDAPTHYNRGTQNITAVYDKGNTKITIVAGSNGSLSQGEGTHYLATPHGGNNSFSTITATAVPDENYEFAGWYNKDTGIISYGATTVFSYTAVEGTYTAIFRAKKTKLTVNINVSGRGDVKYKKLWGSNPVTTINTKQIQPRSVSVDVPEGESLKLTEITPMGGWEIDSTSHAVDTEITNDYDDYGVHEATVNIAFKKSEGEPDGPDADDEDDPDDPDWPPGGGVPGGGDPSVPDDRRDLTITVNYQNGATSEGKLFSMSYETGVSVKPDNPTRLTKVVKGIDYTLTFALVAGDVITSVKVNNVVKTAENNITSSFTNPENTIEVTIHRVASRIITATVTNQIDPVIGEYNTLEIAPEASSETHDGNDYTWGVNATGVYTVTAVPLLGYKLDSVVCTPPDANPYQLTIKPDKLSVDIPDDGKDLSLEFYFTINVVKITISVKNWESEAEKFGLYQMVDSADVPDPLPVGTHVNFVAGAYCGIYRRFGQAYTDSTGISRVRMRAKGTEDWVELAKPDGDSTWLGSFRVPNVDTEVEVIMFCTVNCSVGLPRINSYPTWNGESGGYGKIRLESLDDYNPRTSDDEADKANHSLAEMECLDDGDYWPSINKNDDPRDPSTWPSFYPFVKVEIGAKVYATAVGKKSDGEVQFYFRGFYSGYHGGHEAKHMLHDVSDYTFIVSGPEAEINDADVPSETGSLVKVKAWFDSELPIRYIRVALADQTQTQARVRAKTSNGIQITAEEYWRWRENDNTLTTWDDAPFGALYFKFTDNDGSGEITLLQLEGYGSASYFRWRKRVVVQKQVPPVELPDWQPTGSLPLLNVNLKPVVSMEYEIEFRDDAPPEGENVDVTIGYSTQEDAERGTVYYSKTNDPDTMTDIAKSGGYKVVEHDVNQGVSFMLMAVPDEGYVFLGWFDDNNVELSKASSWSPSITSQVNTFYAKFVEDLVPPDFIKVFVGFADRFASGGADLYLNVNGEPVAVPSSGQLFEFPTSQIESLTLSVNLRTAQRRFWQYVDSYYSRVSSVATDSLIDENKRLKSDTWLLLLRDITDPPEDKVVLRVATYPNAVTSSAGWTLWDITSGEPVALGSTSGRGLVNFYVNPEAKIRITEFSKPNNSTLNSVYIDGAAYGGKIIEFTLIPETEAKDIVSVDIMYRLDYDPPPSRADFQPSTGHGLFLLEGVKEPKKYVWRSRRFEMKVPDAPQTVKIWFDAVNSNDKFALVRFFGYTEPDVPLKADADATLLITGDNMRRIPIMRKEHFWEFEIETNCPVKRLCVGTSATLVATGGKK